MNQKANEISKSPLNDKDSDDGEELEERVYNIEETETPHVITSKKSESPIGISLSDILEGEEDGEEEEEQQIAENDLNAGEILPKTRKRPAAEEEFNTSHFFIKICMYGIILSAWSLIVFYFNLPLEDGILGVQGSEIFVTFLGFMSIVSFYQCSNTSCVNPTQRKPAHIVALASNNFCELCQKWKPERTHHCRSCGQCILRMDHHCFWTCNCVGYRNHKAFLLFCFYSGIGSLYFDYRAIYFFVWAIMDHSVYRFSAYFLIFALVCVFIILPVGLMALGLGIYHFVLAMNNLTTLETLSGINIINPLHVKNLQPKKQINKYDHGVLANLWDFFGHSYLLWWWPTIPNDYYGGQLFAQADENCQKEMEDAKNKKQESKEIQQPTNPKNVKDLNVADILREAEEYAKDKNFHFDTSPMDDDRETAEVNAKVEATPMQDPYIPRRKSFHETEEALRMMLNMNMQEGSDQIYYDEDFDDEKEEEEIEISKRVSALQNRDRPTEINTASVLSGSVEERRKKE